MVMEGQDIIHVVVISERMSELMMDSFIYWSYELLERAGDAASMKRVREGKCDEERSIVILKACAMITLMLQEMHQKVQ